MQEMENRAPILTAHYRERADHFFIAMQHLASDLHFAKTSVALLAVHSAISLNDAIMVAITGRRGKDSEHGKAALELGRLCTRLKIKSTHGVQHLSWLLSNKTDIAYGERRLDDSFLKMSVEKAERFSNWAYTTFREVLRFEQGA